MATTTAQDSHASDIQDRPREGDDVDPPLYCTDEFRIYYMKVLPCSKRYCHDWTTCPFAHPGEKARRRDPRVSNYTGIACPDMKKDGVCVRGELCPYAHNVFEYWLHPTRYRTQLCNDGTNCKRRVCFFAHTLSELRVPSSKPFVNPQALAAAAAAAGARRAGSLDSQLASEVARLRGGIIDVNGAGELARRLASLQVGQTSSVQQQLAAAAAQQQQQQQHARQQAQSEQNALLLQLLSTMLQQKESQVMQQQRQQVPPELQGQIPTSEALAALYQQLGAGSSPQMFDPGFSQQDPAAMLASLDPMGHLAAHVYGKDENTLQGGSQHPTPRSSLDVAAGLQASEYSTPSSFDFLQNHTPRSSFDMHAYSARSSFDSQRRSLDVARPANCSVLQDVAEGEPAQHGVLNAGATPFESSSASGSSPMAFGPGGAYFLTGASAACAANAAEALGIGADGDLTAVNGRSVSLPVYLQKPGFNAAAPSQYHSALPGLHQGASFADAAQDPRRASFDVARFGSGDRNELPPKAPHRFSMDSRMQQQQGASNAFQQHLIGALPGSFNYSCFSEPLPRNGGLGLSASTGAAESESDTRPSNSPPGSEPASLFSSSGETGIPNKNISSINLGALYEPTAQISRAGSGGASPHRSIWSPQP